MDRVATTGGTLEWTTEMAQWHLLFGAMLASKEVLTEALKKIHKQDVPTPWQPFWESLATGDRGKVWDMVGKFGIQQPTPLPPNASVTARLIHSLQEIGLAEFVKKQVSRAEFSHKALLGADAVADTFESVAASIRQRQAQIQNGGNGK